MSLEPSNRPRIKRWIRRASLRLGLGLGIGAVTTCLVAWCVAGALVAPAQRAIGLPPSDLPIESISLASQSGATLSGWHLRARESQGVVVLLHGIRSDRTSMLQRARALHTRGFSSVLIDLQAHGESEGQRITIGYLEKHDAVAAVEFARSQHPGAKIGIIGVSLGGAAALLASPLNVDALVIESVYSDIQVAFKNRVQAKLGVFASIPTAMLAWQLKPRLGISTSDLRPIESLPDVDCAILIAGGTSDLHTRASETRQMFNQAPQPKQLWLAEGLGHEDLYRAAPRPYETQVFGFLERYLTGNSSRSD